MASAASSSQSSASRKGTPGGKYYQGDGSGSLKDDPRYRKLEEEEALRFLQTKDAEWFSRNYNGEVAPSGYLVNKAGKETNTLPSQAINNGLEEVEAAARKRFTDTYPDAETNDERLTSSSKEGSAGRRMSENQLAAERVAQLNAPKRNLKNIQAAPAGDKQRKDWSAAQAKHQDKMNDWRADTDRAMKEQRERGRRFSPEEAKERFNQYKQERKTARSYLTPQGGQEWAQERLGQAGDATGDQPGSAQSERSVLDVPNNSRNKSFTDRQKEGAERLAQFLQPGGAVNDQSGYPNGELPDRPPGDPNRKKASSFELARRSLQLARDQQRAANTKDTVERGKKEAKLQKDLRDLKDNSLHKAGVSEKQLAELGGRVATLMAAGTGIGLVIAAPKANITAANRYINSRILYFGYRTPEERANNPGTKYLNLIDVMIAVIVNLMATWYLLPVIGILIIIVLIVAVAVLASEFGPILGPIITSQLGI